MATVTRLPVKTPCEVCGDPATCVTATGWILCARHFAPPASVVARDFGLPIETVRDRAMKLGMQRLTDGIEDLCSGDAVKAVEVLLEARQILRSAQ